MSLQREHTVPTARGPLPARLWLPRGAQGRVPGLVVLQEIFGLSDYVQQRCSDLADLGYAVLAPQLYARLDPPVAAVAEQGRDPQEMLTEAMGLMQRLDWDQAVQDVRATMTELGGLGPVDEDAVGLVGFCFGGGLAFDVAARSLDGRPPAVLVSFYGSALPQLLDRADQVDCPSLHVFGTADDYLPMDQVERIREAVTAGGTRDQVQVELHEGAGHAFDNPHPLFHHPEASAAAWRQTEQFLARELPVDGQQADPGGS